MNITTILWNDAHEQVQYNIESPDSPIAWEPIPFMNAITVAKVNLSSAFESSVMHIGITDLSVSDPVVSAYEVVISKDKRGWIDCRVSQNDETVCGALGYSATGIVILKLKTEVGGNIVIGVIDIDP